MKFKINKEYKLLNPKISFEDYSNLKNSIECKGILNPIHILIDGTILCGHNRYTIWVNDLKKNEEAIPYKVVNINPLDKNKRMSREIIDYIIGDNIDRRNFTMKERIEQHILLLGIDAKKQSIADKQSGNLGTDISNFTFSSKNKLEIDKHQKIIDYIIKSRRG